MRTIFMNPGRNRQGFTLVEVVIAITIALIVMAALTGVFLAHSRTFNAHDDIAAVQQNVRGAMMVMPAEIRLAGCDPLEKHDAEVLAADETTFDFTADIGGKSSSEPNEPDGEINGPGERVAYKFCQDRATCRISPSSDGGYDCIGPRTPGLGVICRKVMPNSGKWSGGSFQPLAQDIERMEFHYILRKKTGKGFETTRKLRRDDFGRVSAVQISLLARGEFQDSQFYDSKRAYIAASGDEWTLDDIYAQASETDQKLAHLHRRRLVINTVQLRNLGGK